MTDTTNTHAARRAPSTARIDCGLCVHAKGNRCFRDGDDFKQSYERRYTDDDFCGPDARFFKKRRSLIRRIFSALGIYHQERAA